MTEIPESAEWYVRGALARALVAVDQDIAKLQSLIDSDVPGMWKESARGLLDYDIQWRAEAIDAFRALPDAIRPILPDALTR